MKDINRTIIAAAAAVVALLFQVQEASAQDVQFNSIPSAWKWISDQEVIFSYNGTYKDSSAFVVNARNMKVTTGRQAPEKFYRFPVQPEHAVNLTYSPDSTMLAFTRGNDLYTVDIATGKERRLTFDGTDLIMNGYASWVYYEEILGRPSRYRAFWWSPDSKKIGFYHFDNTQVPLFPIYSPFGQDGKLKNTRYPKCGERNPEVRIGMVDLTRPADAQGRPEIVWADFNEKEDQYFGIPFWGKDSDRFFIARMPRLQNTLELFSVDVRDGSKTPVYKEQYKTWLDWISEVIFTDEGLYMARNFETGWEQIYFLSYDGKEFRRLTDGINWSIRLVKVDEKKGDVYYIAKRDATVRSALYKVDRKGHIEALTDPDFDVTGVRFSPDGKHFVASYSNGLTPTRVALFKTSERASQGHVVADMKGKDYDASRYALPELIWMTTADGFRLPANIVYPKNFDKTRKYPVHMNIYGGPDAPVVKDRWSTPSESNQWWSDNGIIQIWADCRAAGHNGRAGLDMIYRHLATIEVEDFIAWADYLKALPYVNGDKIGVEGFSFGGTMTSMLLFKAPDRFHYGIAGGGVYDWALYDSHYTERYMDTPQNNPEGYKKSSTLEYVKGYPVTYGQGDDEPVMLKITHGTGDDNVHFQNTLQLIDALHKEGKKFEFMIYPDGMHGYGGYQGAHFKAANREFWEKHLLGR